MEIEKIADNRYRLRAHGQLITLSAQGLLDVYEYVLVNANTLTREAIAAKEADQEYEDTRKYMEHYYEGGE